VVPSRLGDEMRSFRVPGMDPQEFVEQVRRALANHDMAGHVTLQLAGDDLVVRLEYMGTTRLHYRLERDGDGLAARLVGERVALLHAPFRDAFDTKFADIISKVGGSVP